MKNIDINIKIAIDEEIRSISRLEKYNTEYKYSNMNDRQIKKQARYLKRLDIDTNL